MKPTICLLFFAAVFPANVLAGFVGELNLGSSAPNPDASLDHRFLGPQSPLVGTNLAVPSITNLTSNPFLITSLAGYLDFTTGAYASTDSSGNVHYSPGGDFYVLDGPLSTAAGVRPALAGDVSTGSAVVQSLGSGVFELTMGFTNAHLSARVAGPLGVPVGSGYDGTLDMMFVVNPALAGNQLLTGTISFLPQSIPEPNSLVLLCTGCVGLLVFAWHRQPAGAMAKAA